MHQQTSQLYSAEQSSPDLPVLIGRGVSAYLRGGGVCVCVPPMEPTKKVGGELMSIQVFFRRPCT